MKEKSKPRLPHLRPAQAHLKVRGWFLSENVVMPPGQQVKVLMYLINGINMNNKHVCKQ